MEETTVVNINSHHKKMTVYIGRPSRWGNPFIIGRDGTRGEVVEKYEHYLLNNLLLFERVRQLRGKVLGCYCRPRSCHGDVLARWADKHIDIWVAHCNELIVRLEEKGGELW